MRIRSAAVLAAVAALVVALDQFTKAIVRDTLPFGHSPVPLVGSLVRLNHVRNLGAAFGMLPGHKVVFITVMVLVIVGIGVYVWRWRPTSRWTLTGLGMVAGGAVGNGIDRIASGMVTDFIQIPFDFPVFNIADCGIVVGVSMLIWWLLFGPGPGPEHDPAAAPPPADDPSGA